MVIEQFRDGATVRGFLQPTFHWVTVFLSGVSCPGFKRPEVLFFMLLSLFLVLLRSRVVFFFRVLLRSRVLARSPFKYFQILLLLQYKQQQQQQQTTIKNNNK
jgi:hypothetical protein